MLLYYTWNFQYLNGYKNKSLQCSRILEDVKVSALESCISLSSRSSAPEHRWSTWHWLCTTSVSFYTYYMQPAKAIFTLGTMN